jgi:hypothetical protein
MSKSNKLWIAFAICAALSWVGLGILFLLPSIILLFLALREEVKKRNINARVARDAISSISETVDTMNSNANVVRAKNLLFRDKKRTILVAIAVLVVVVLIVSITGIGDMKNGTYRAGSSMTVITCTVKGNTMTFVGGQFPRSGEKWTYKLDGDDIIATRKSGNISQMDTWRKIDESTFTRGSWVFSKQ